MNKVSCLVVCGDSYNARALADKPEYRGTHWSEVLSDLLNCKLINLASSGCSNRMIVFQLLEALKYPDALVIGAPAANYTRFDLLRNIDKMHRSKIDLKSFENKTDLDSENPFLRSVNINFIERESNLSITEIETLLKHTPLGLYKHIDRWGIFYALSQLIKQKANFLFFQNTGDVDLLPVAELIDLIGNRLITTDQFDIKKYRIIDNNIDDPGYHTTPDSQKEIANYLFNRIKNDI